MCWQGIFLLWGEKIGMKNDVVRNRKTDKRDKGILILIIVATLGGYLAAYHDMQTADGVGLYLAMKFGQKNRLPFDLLCDGIRMAGFLGLLGATCAVRGHRSLTAFARLMCAWLAFMPILSMAELLHLPDEAVRGMTLADSGLLERFVEGESVIAGIFKAWLPLFFLLFCGYVLKKPGTKVPGWYRICVVIQALLLACVFIIPGWSAAFVEILLYLLLVMTFDLWERWLSENPALEKWSALLFGLMWLRGIFRLVELMSIK